MRHVTFAILVAGIGASASFLIPRSAEACWTCTSDSECPTGFSCDESGACMPTVDCSADSDCGAGMRCVIDTATECTSTDNSTCHPINACAPDWQAGCGSDADCGDGFTCVQNGSMCNSAGCSAISVCQAKESDPTTCNADSDCPSCWSCLDASDTGETCVNPGGPATGVNQPAGSGSASSGSAGSSSTSSGSANTSDTSASSSSKICRPPYWGLSIGYAGPAPHTAAGSGTASGIAPSANLCPNLAATRAGYSGVDPKSGGSGSAGGCSVSSTPGSNDSAPLFGLVAALAGVAVLERRKRRRPTLG
ncbi:MAG: hypothetical protein ACRELY_30880 [Polyangiaceae bacterium]